MYFFEHGLNLLIGLFPVLLLNLQLPVHFIQFLLDAFRNSICIIFPMFLLVLYGGLQVK